MRKLIVAGAGALALTFSLPAASHAAEYFVPQGHTYSPGTERLPALNSRRDRVQARTDEIEAEIYRRQLEQRRFIEQLNSFEDHVFGDRTRRWNNW
ncbi:MAG: hypothetical protein AAF441_23435 [Pseudomonadota bacterium]